MVHPGTGPWFNSVFLRSMATKGFKFRRDLRALNRRVREWRMIALGVLSRDHPVMAHIIPIRRCNLSCTYCNEYDDFSKPIAAGVMMERLDRLADLGTTIITFSGGEPLLHPDLDALIAHVRRRNVISGLITNGYLLTPQRIKQLNDRVVAPHEVLIQRVHRHPYALVLAHPRQHRPALRNRINLAFHVFFRAKRRAIVKVSATIPFAIPAMFLDSPREPGSLIHTTCGESFVAIEVRNLCELHKHFTKEKAQPDAFTFAVFADHVHAVVPIAGSDQRQAVCTCGESS